VSVGHAVRCITVGWPTLAGDTATTWLSCSDKPACVLQSMLLYKNLVKWVLGGLEVSATSDILCDAVPCQLDCMAYPCRLI